MAITSCVTEMITFPQAREVEYRNKMDDEWELFQRVMKDESTVRKTYLPALFTTTKFNSLTEIFM